MLKTGMPTFEKSSKKTLKKLKVRSNHAEHDKSTGWLSRLLKRDEEWGYFVFQQRNRSSVLKVSSDVLSLTGDEVIFFGIVASIAVSMSLIRVCGLLRDMGCIEEALWDFFGSCSTCTFIESILKVTFRRERPKYIEQSHFVSIYGEWFSFPSGHSLRSFYFVFWISRSRFMKLLGHIIPIPRARMCIPWAFGVGWSRVAKGKHFPIDVFCGAILGVGIGWLVEDYLTGYGRAVVKTISGIYTVANWVYFMLVPVLAGDNQKKHVIFTFLFYVYALSLLYSSLPGSSDLAGGQTIESIDDGSSTCRKLW